MCVYVGMLRALVVRYKLLLVDFEVGVDSENKQAETASKSHFSLPPGHVAVVFDAVVGGRMRGRLRRLGELVVPVRIQARRCGAARRTRRREALFAHVRFLHRIRSRTRVMVDPADALGCVTAVTATAVAMAATAWVLMAPMIRAMRAVPRASVPRIVRQRFDSLESAAGLRTDGRHTAETGPSRSHAQVEVARVDRSSRRGVIAVLLEVRGQQDGAVNRDRESAVPASDHHSADDEL